MNYVLEGEEIFQKILEQIKILFIPSINNNYQPKFLQSNILEYIIIFIFVLKIISIAPTLPLPNNIFFADITKIDLVELLNNERKGMGVKLLSKSTQLTMAINALKTVRPFEKINTSLAFITKPKEKYHIALIDPLDRTEIVRMPLPLL